MADGKLYGNLELQNINQTHSYNTRLRHNNNFYTTTFHTNLTKSSFSYAGPKLWREVPTNLKSVNDKYFGKLYKRYLHGCYCEE